MLKRAVRQYEMGKITFKMQQDAAKKTKEYDQPQSRTPLELVVMLYDGALRFTAG